VQSDVERLVARLLTDGGFRERFLADPQGIASQEGLSAEETAAVTQVSAQDLRTAARSYQHKRDSGVRRRGRSWLVDWLRGWR
jgi:hypothetical protein